MATWHVEIANFPYDISQFGAWTEDGLPPEDASLQCWAACDSAIIKHRTGVLVSPDTVKDYSLGQNEVGTGNSTNIQKGLTHWSVPSALSLPIGKQPLLKVEFDHLMKGKACVIDRYLHFPGNTEKHWMNVIGQYGHDYVVDYVVLHDPETGSRIIEHVDTHLAMAFPLPTGEFVLVTEE